MPEAVEKDCFEDCPKLAAIASSADMEVVDYFRAGNQGLAFWVSEAKRRKLAKD